MQLHAPAADRNKGPIFSVLKSLLPPSGTVLEVASGTGQHVMHFAEQTPHLRWQPSDPDAQSRASITAYTHALGLTNVALPLDLDVLKESWPPLEPAAIVNINMLHIAPWLACTGLMRHASRLLAPGGLLFLYGPFLSKDVPTEPSNQDFDASLRARNPDWGIRPLEQVTDVAASYGLAVDGSVAMPANNISLFFRRS